MSDEAMRRAREIVGHRGEYMATPIVDGSADAQRVADRIATRLREIGEA